MQHVFEWNLRGELAVTVLEADADHTSILYQFRGPQVQFQAEGQDAPAQSWADRSRLGRPASASSMDTAKCFRSGSTRPPPRFRKI